MLARRHQIPTLGKANWHIWLYEVWLLRGGDHQPQGGIRVFKKMFGPD